MRRGTRRSETERKGERKEGEGADYWGRGVRGTTARGDAAWSGEGSTGPSGLSERGKGPLSGWRRRVRFGGLEQAERGVQASASWAEGGRGEGEGGVGRCWVDLGRVLGLGYGFLFYFFFFSISNSNKV